MRDPQRSAPDPAAAAAARRQPCRRRRLPPRQLALAPASPSLQLKAGEVHASAAVATELLKPAQPTELQILGYTLLQHLVRGLAGLAVAAVEAR